MGGAGDKTRPRVPSALQQLILGYLNTCRFMARFWFRAMVVLLFLLPLGFYGAVKSSVEALVSGVMFWLIIGAISRFLVFEFRQLRAARVARRIDRRIPRSSPSRLSLIEWIGEHNDGNYLNTLLKKLGVPPRTARAYTTPLAEGVGFPTDKVEGITGALFEKISGAGSQGGSVQTHVYTTSQTQMLKDGEWVTVHSETSTDGDGTSPSEAVQKALAMLNDDDEPPPGFEPIPVSSAEQSVPAAAAARERNRPGRERPSLDYMPLEPDRYDPDGDDPPDAKSKR